MSKGRKAAEGLTEAEIERRFAEADVAWLAQQRRQIREQWKGYSRLREAALQLKISLPNILGTPADRTMIVPRESLGSPASGLPKETPISNGTRQDASDTAEAAVLSTPEGAAVFCKTLFDYIIFCCEFEMKPGGEPVMRSAWKRKRELIKEAEAFEKGNDWRAGNPVLAAEFARALRERAAKISNRARGRPAGTTDNPARYVVDTAISALQDEARRRGRDDLVDKVLDPGKSGDEDHGKLRAPSGIGAAGAMVKVLAEFFGVPLSEDGIRRAVDNRRRAERRKRRRSST